jgi:hypothetical protein
MYDQESPIEDGKLVGVELVLKLKKGLRKKKDPSPLLD